MYYPVEETVDDVGSPLYLLAANVLWVSGLKEGAQWEKVSGRCKEGAQRRTAWLKFLLVTVVADNVHISMEGGGPRGEEVGSVVCVDQQQRRGDAHLQQSRNPSHYFFPCLSAGLDVILLLYPFRS